MIALIRAAVERGVTFFDTAEVYGPFTNEELVGEALAPVPRPGRDRHQVRLRASTRTAAGQGGLDSRPEHIRQVAEASLKRLEVDAIDLLLPAPRRPERADRGRRRRGQGADRARARSGTSACPRPACRRSAARTPSSRSTALQSEYSLWWRRAGGGDPADARGARASASCRSARSARASSPGKIDETTTFDKNDFRNIVPRFTPEARKANQALVDLLGRDRGAARARRRRRSRSPGCSRRSRGSCHPRHDEAARASRRTSARPTSSSRPTTCARSRAPRRVTIRRAVPRGAGAGDRYPEELERMTGVSEPET